jgi:acyl carrier protein
MTDAADRVAIDATVRDVLGIVLERPINPTENVGRDSEAAWDSLKHIEILLALEGALEVRFDESELPELTSLASIVAAAERHIGP